MTKKSELIVVNGDPIRMTVSQSHAISAETGQIQKRYLKPMPEIAGYEEIEMGEGKTIKVPYISGFIDTESSDEEAPEESKNRDFVTLAFDNKGQLTKSVRPIVFVPEEDDQEE